MVYGLELSCTQTVRFPASQLSIAQSRFAAGDEPLRLVGVPLLLYCRRCGVTEGGIAGG